MTAVHHRCPADFGRKIGLVLQGGGALGSYQAGVYEALAEAAYLPDWVAGISIGAINAAIIAGNAPQDRAARLRDFWEQVTAAPHPWGEEGETLAALLTGDHRPLSAAAAMLFGQRGFFAPLDPAGWWRAAASGQPPIAPYDTSALRGTLERLVDFDRINAGGTRLSVRAVQVASGNVVSFDSARMRLGPEHVMASGALPPGFPPVEIEGEAYWDGGLVSNTPLHDMIETVPRRSRLIFQVDLFAARGFVPRTLPEAQERAKDVRFSSRTRAATDGLKRLHDVRHMINELLEKLPQDYRDLPEARWLYEFGCVTTMDVVQLVYRPGAPQGRAKDIEFSRSTMERRWAQGRRDAERAVAASPWLEPMPRDVGARSFDLGPAP
jgi:NTE family protein